MSGYKLHGMPVSPDVYQLNGGDSACAPALPHATIKWREEALGATITLPYPVSANRYWRTGRNGRVYVSTEAKDYKKQVAEIAKSEGVKMLTCSVSVILRVFRPQRSGDLDNRIKILLDALSGVLYDDDKRIVEIHAYRFEDRLNPRAEVEVKAA